MNPFHSPQELQYYINVGHWVEGAILGVVALVSLIQLLGYLKTGAVRYLIPILIFLGGLFLSPYLLLHHGLNNFGTSWYYIVNDAAELQHFIMGNLLIMAGLVEILVTAEALKSKLWLLVFPLSVAVIGMLFLIHPQHGIGIEFIRATRIHHYLGWLLIGGGIIQAVASQHDKYLRLSYIWILALVVSAGLLIIYREPSGSFHSPMPLQIEKYNSGNQHH